MPLSKHFDNDLHVYHDVETCRKLWTIFTQDKTLFDLWDFRIPWYQAYHFKLHFYTLEKDSHPTALLPLWHRTDVKRFEWFGGSWIVEGNNFFAQRKEHIDMLLNAAPKPLLLTGLTDTSNLSIVVSDTPNYFKDISKINTIDEFLATLQKKHRYNLQRDYNRIKNMDIQVHAVEGKHYNKLDMLFELSKLRFTQSSAEESDFFDTETQDVYRYLLKNNNKFESIFIEATIADEIVAIDLVLIYNKIYYPWIGASKTEKYNGLGNFMLMWEINDAVKNGNAVIDCCQNDYGWKHRYFDERCYYKIDMPV